jgi:hypothetical protein
MRSQEDTYQETEEQHAWCAGYGILHVRHKVFDGQMSGLCAGCARYIHVIQKRFCQRVRLCPVVMTTCLMDWRVLFLEQRCNPPTISKRIQLAPVCLCPFLGRREAQRLGAWRRAQAKQCHATPTR